MMHEFYPDTPIPSAITEFAVLVTTKSGSHHLASGTAVLVAPYLALCARHVLKDHWDLHENHRRMPEVGSVDLSFEMLLVQLVGGQANLWSVSRLWTILQTDIMALEFAPCSVGATAYEFKNRFTIDLAPPKVGDRVTAFGYHENRVEHVEGKSVQHSVRAATSAGDVVRVYDSHRDTGFLHFPCFEVDARYQHGMSGGPVVNEDGRLCGLVCGGSPLVAEGQGYSSFAVTLWPAMAIPIELNRVGHPKGERYRLFDLVAERIVLAENAGRVVIGPLDRDGATIGLLAADEGTKKGQARFPSPITEGEPC